jgi:hypothetical protein
VSDGENANLTVYMNVDDMVREARNRPSSRWEIRRRPRHGGPSVGQPHDLVDGGVDGVEELDAQVLSMVLVPSTGGAIFRIRLFLETNVPIHRRLRSSVSAR